LFNEEGPPWAAVSGQWLHGRLLRVLIKLILGGERPLPSHEYCTFDNAESPDHEQKERGLAASLEQLIHDNLLFGLQPEREHAWWLSGSEIEMIGCSKKGVFEVA